MKAILVTVGLILFAVVLAGGGLLIFKGGDIIKMGAEKGLLMVRSQVEQALPANYSADKVRQEFDVAIKKVKAGEVDTGELKALLSWIPAQLQDGKLNSVKVDSVIQRLHKVVAWK